MKILGIDTETTGIDDDADLLTSYFGVYDEELTLIDELEMIVKPDSGVYRVEPRALEVNHIDLVKHSKQALTYKEVKPEVYKFLSGHSAGGRMIALGHGTAFDVRKITQTVISKASWEQFVSYRVLDTATIAQFLQVVGLLPKSLDAGLGKLATYFALEWEGEAHTAKADVLMTVEVFKKLAMIL